MQAIQFRNIAINKKTIAAAAAILAVALYSGWWWLTARSLDGRIDGWIAAEQAKGAKITPGSVSVGGYPLAFAIRVSDFALIWPNGFGFSGQNLRVAAHPWSFNRFKITAIGGFAFNLPPGDARPPLTLAGQTLRGSATFYNTAVPTDVKLTADTVSASLTGVEGAAARELSVATVEFTGSRPETQPAADTDIAFDLSLRLIDLSARALETNPLGATINETVIHAKLLGVPPATADRAGLQVWRDAGGTVEATQLSTRWGPLDLTGTGTVALDKDMQPEAAFTAHFSGFEQAIDALQGAGWIKPSGASVAKLALGLAALPGPDGKPVVKMPVTIQNRHISMGPIKLGEVPELKLD